MRPDRTAVAITFVNSTSRKGSLCQSESAARRARAPCVALPSSMRWTTMLVSTTTMDGEALVAAFRDPCFDFGGGQRPALELDRRRQRGRCSRADGKRRFDERHGFFGQRAAVALRARLKRSMKLLGKVLDHPRRHRKFPA